MFLFTALNKKIKNHKCCISAVLIIIILIFSAGCITETQPELPSEENLTSTLDEFSQVIKNKTIETDKRITNYAHEIEGAGADASDDEINSIVRRTYIDNIKLRYLSYYDARCGKTYYAPESKITSVGFTEKIYRNVSFDEHQTLLYGPIFSETHGVICAFVHPVYQNGEYSGIVVGYNDPVDFVTDAALECGGLNGLGAIIIDTDGIVFYSPFTTDIGLNIYGFNPDEKKGISEQMVETESGISEVFEGYTPGIYPKPLSRQVAWNTVNVFNKDLRVGLSSCEKVPELPDNYKPDYKSMEKAVQEVYIYAYEHGKENTIKALNEGKFDDYNFDIFALDVNGTILASQKRPYQVGLNLVNWRSAYAAKTADIWNNLVVTSGGGYNYFTVAATEDPTEDEGILTASYLMLVDSDWYIGSMIPMQTDRNSINIETKNSLLNTLQTTLRMYEEDGEDAFQKYMHKEGTQLEGNNHYIVVLDYDGNVLASSEHPNHVGRNIISMSMHSTGISITRIQIMMAEKGGGFLTADMKMSEDSDENVGIFYVEPLDDNSFIYVMDIIRKNPAVISDT